MKIIPLPDGSECYVDDVDYDWLIQFHWHRQRKYVVRSYKRYKITHMHVLLLPDVPDGCERDHIDGNGLNNQRSNLRVATKNQNAQNRRKSRGISRYKGVKYRCVGNNVRWIAQIYVKGKALYIGSFVNELDAALAYDAVALREFGDFARVNFPHGDLRCV